MQYGGALLAATYPRKRKRVGTQGAPPYLQLKRTILDFVGIRNRSVRYFGPLISADVKARQRWLQQVSQQAARL